MSESVILSNRGQPFGSDAAALKHLKAAAMDPTRYKVIRYSGGWAIQDGGYPDLRPAAPPAQEGPKPTGPAAYWVQFNLAQSENESSNVFVALNNDKIYAERGVPVCLSVGHIEVLKTSLLKDCSQLPDRPEMRIRMIMPNPYSVLREASAEELRRYRSIKANGGTGQDTLALFQCGIEGSPVL